MSLDTTVRVLIIDDDAEDTKLMTDLLKEAQRSHFLVETAATAAEGLSVLRRSKFDVVLLDYRLPDMDGISFMDTLRQERFRVPVVVVTSHGDRTVQVRSVEAGAAEYLEKGTFNADLLERTCVYAIGIQERKNSDGTPGIGVLISQLVELTRDSVRSNTEATAEIKGLRQDLAFGVRSIQADVASHDATAKEGCRQVREDIRYAGKIRWFLDWAKTNPVPALIIFVCLVVVLALGIVLVTHATPEQIKAVLGAADSTQEVGAPWMPA